MAMVPTRRRVTSSVAACVGRSPVAVAVMACLLWSDLESGSPASGVLAVAAEHHQQHGREHAHVGDRHHRARPGMPPRWRPAATTVGDHHGPGHLDHGARRCPWPRISSSMGMVMLTAITRAEMTGSSIQGSCTRRERRPRRTPGRERACRRTWRAPSAGSAARTDASSRCPGTRSGAGSRPVLLSVVGWCARSSRTLPSGPGMVHGPVRTRLVRTGDQRQGAHSPQCGAHTAPSVVRRTVPPRAPRNLSTASTRRSLLPPTSESELVEDVRHVLLDRPHGDVQPLRDGRVGQAPGSPIAPRTRCSRGVSRARSSSVCRRESICETTVGSRADPPCATRRTAPMNSSTSATRSFSR